MSTVHLSMPLPAPLTPPGDAALTLLDHAVEWAAFSVQDSVQPEVWHSNMSVQGMYCAACALTLEDALRQIPGVLRVQVQAGQHTAAIAWEDTRTRPSQWMQAAAHSGYTLLPAHDPAAATARRRESRKALWRWLVAGLCMMQVMMYAYPAYVARAGDLSAEMEQLLRWASWVLTLPVILFSCGPFFRNALRDLALRRVSMDLPVALGIGITFAVSSLGTFAPQGPWGHEVYFDSLTMFVFFLLTGRWLELRLRGRTAGALETLIERLPASVLRRNPAGEFVAAAPGQLRVGDVLRVAPGAAFAADGCILSGSTQVDESLLTGESRPLLRGPGDAVVAGSYNLGATVDVQALRLGRDTRFAQIVDLMDSAARSKPHLAQLADRVARPFLIGVLLAAALACAWWWPQDPAHALMVAVSVLVVTCPCALSLATPAAMLAGAGRLARQGVLVRRLGALETLAQVDTVVFDKTGTLTSDRLALVAVALRRGERRDDVLAIAAALGAHSLHPVARALGDQALVPTWECAGVQETPGQGVQAEILERTTGQQRSVRLGSAAFCGVTETNGDALQVHLRDDLGWLASFSLQENLRAHANQVVQQLQAAGVAVQILSGDAPASVARVAAAAGIDQARGACSPQDKLLALRELQAQGHRVLMVGDGINDGPVLAGADVSMAFGQAVPLAQSQSDFVLLGAQLPAVAQTVLLARKTLAVVRQNLAWALIYNLACVPLAVAGMLPAWAAGLGMASSSLAVVLNAMRLARTEG